MQFMVEIEAWGSQALVEAVTAVEAVRHEVSGSLRVRPLVGVPRGVRVTVKRWSEVHRQWLLCGEYEAF